MYNYKWYAYLLIIINLIIEPYISKWFSIGVAYPDILLILMFMFSMGRKDNHVLIVSASTGFIYDMLYSRFLGPMTVLLFLRGLLSIAIGRRFKKENIVILTLAGLVTAFISRAYTIMLSVGIKDFFKGFSMFITDIGFSAIYTALIITVITAVMFMIYNSYGKRSKRLLYGRNNQNS
ncbi:MAG: rod shape-determining protein MreD [Clostridia bacterium]|jgi:rod shape-determining protein MreD|nr:rod shape-determining protein MreD [Clostridia bacterium]NLV33953.1 rod shape-determining protein MreD [Clostridiaceae bacterium]HQO69107.1 rod shape-determining protein MreD [Clostridia bacterium]